MFCHKSLEKNGLKEGQIFLMNAKGSDINFFMMKMKKIPICKNKIMKVRLYTYFTMTFSYEFQYPNDKVKFAYCIPYTYTEMLCLLK